MHSSLRNQMLVKSLGFALVVLLGYSVPRIAESSPIAFSTTYTGSFSSVALDSLVNVLTTSTSMTDPGAPFGLTSGSFSHNALIPGGNVNSPQSITNGSVTLIGGGNSLTATYTGSFLVTDFPTNQNGTFTFGLLVIGGSGTFAGATGSGTIGGTTFFPSGASSLAGNFTANVDLAVQAPAVPEPASLTLLVAGLGIIGYRVLRQRRRTL